MSTCIVAALDANLRLSLPALPLVYDQPILLWASQVDASDT